MINRRHPDINILPPPINNWITVCPYERCPISWARIPSIISSESKSNPSVMHSVCLPRANQLHYKKVNGELPGAELLQRTMTIPTMANLLGIREATAYELIHRLHFRSVKTEYSSQRLLIDKATFYEWLKSQTHYKIVEGKEDFYDREELSEAQ